MRSMACRILASVIVMAAGCGSAPAPRREPKGPTPAAPVTGAVETSGDTAPKPVEPAPAKVGEEKPAPVERKGSAALRLDNYYTDNMVLQRGKPIVVKGTATTGAKVAVAFAGRTVEAVTDDNGRWSVTLAPLPASAEGRDLACRIVDGDAAVKLRDVVVGDVWLVGRQSHIDVTLGSTDTGRRAANAYGGRGEFRAIRITTVPAKTPLDDLASEASSGWAKVDGRTALTLTGSAFYIGRELAQALDVPVGIVDVDMGPYFAIGWLSDQAISESIAMYPQYKDLQFLPEHMRDLAEERDSGREKKAIDEEHQKRYGKLIAEGKDAPPKPSMGLHPLKSPIYPGAGHNAVLTPLKGVAMKGVLLQLGGDYPFVPYSVIAKEGKGQIRPELNQAWGQSYWILKWGFRITAGTVPMVPKDWRRTLGDERLPIGLIMPPGSDLYAYALHNREMREMHRRISERTPGVGAIMPGTEHIPLSGQPLDDKLVAERSLTWVLGSVYGRDDVTPTGPMFERAETRLSEATVHFKKGTASGLRASGKALEQFEVSGPDGEWHFAKARIEGATIKIKSDDVNNVQFVRYNWVERPEQGLVNGAGLPAVPFTSYPEWEFAWIVANPGPALPSEYSTTADKWSKSAVAIINGTLRPDMGGDSQKIPKWLGPTGIFSDQFGPNIYVHGADPGSPADGKFLKGDIIYGVNGKVFGDDHYRQLADAITFSESEAGGGKIVFGVRRGAELMDIELQLDVMGSFSSTSPYFCPKSENIVRKAEKWMSQGFRPESGFATEPKGFLDTNIHFLMAAGTPEHQGIVRRAVYGLMARMTPLRPAEYGVRTSNWPLGHNALLFGEYYHATGDRNVLPYLKNLNEWSAMTQLKPRAETPEKWEAASTEEQIGGWRHNGFTTADRAASGYGLLPHAGMACVMGMKLAIEAGIETDETAYERGLNHFHKGRAEHGFVLYSYGGLQREGPAPLDPIAESKGMLWSMNGKLGMAAALFGMVDNEQTVEICSRYCVYGFNNTRHGHGGMFFNNYWTPIGAHFSGERGFKHFMKGQRWWRELYRRHDGSFTQAGRGGIGVAYALHRVAHEKRLRYLGAPRSAFGKDAPKYLASALEAHRGRDYALCEGLVLKVMKEQIIPAEELPTVRHLLESVRRLRKSIDHDLALVERLIGEKRYYHAGLELPQLKGVVAGDDPRLAAIVKALDAPEIVALAKKEYDALRNESRARDAERKRKAKAADTREWTNLTTQIITDRRRVSPGQVEEEDATVWRMRVVESIEHAPEGWTKPGFDDGDWPETTVPISWRLYHTTLFRGKLNIDDKKKFDMLRLRGTFFRQLNVKLYINGVLVAQIDNIGSPVNAELTDLAMDVLKNGENTVALTMRHDRRWGPMRGKYTTVSHNGAGFSLDARLAEEDGM